MSSCILSKTRQRFLVLSLFPPHTYTNTNECIDTGQKACYLNIDFECQQIVIFYRTTGKFVQKKLFLRISEQSANSLQIPHRLWLWNQMTFPVSLLYSLLRPMSVWHQTEQRWLVFGSDDVYSENGLDFSAAVSKRIICVLSKYGSMTRHMSASILPLNSFMA